MPGGYDDGGSRLPPSSPPSLFSPSLPLRREPDVERWSPSQRVESLPGSLRWRLILRDAPRVSAPANFVEAPDPVGPSKVVRSQGLSRRQVAVQGRAKVPIQIAGKEARRRRPQLTGPET